MADEYEYESEPAITEQESRDVELITSYLNGQLGFAEAAEVEHRLETDPAFFEFAEPLMIAWSVPAPWQREPVDPHEVERQWDRFTKAAGFVHQKKKSRRRAFIIVAAVALALAIGAFLARHRIEAKWEDVRDYDPVQTVNGVAHLPNDATVTLTAGSSLRIRVRDARPDVDQVRLRGDAHVLMLRPPMQLSPTVKFKAVIIEAGGARATTNNAEFTVATRGDTVAVAVLHRRRLDHPTDLFDQLPDIVVVASAAYPLRLVQLREGERALIVADQPVQSIPAGQP